MPSPTLPEISLFLLLVIASGVLFYRRISPVVITILKSRPDPGFALDSLSRRIRDFIWEVLCQGKVIKERPLPGIAHAFVFWGFCAFGLVTLNHFATGLGFPFLSIDSGFGRTYFYLAAFFAIAVTISIAGLT